LRTRPGWILFLWKGKPDEEKAPGRGGLAWGVARKNELTEWRRDSALDGFARLLTEEVQGVGPIGNKKPYPGGKESSVASQKDTLEGKTTGRLHKPQRERAPESGQESELSLAKALAWSPGCGRGPKGEAR